MDPSDPVGGYLDFAARAPQPPIPQAADPDYHLSTLFPPVRPRGGYIEVRYLDAKPPDRIIDAVECLDALLNDRHARRAARSSEPSDPIAGRVADQILDDLSWWGLAAAGGQDVRLTTSP